MTIISEVDEMFRLYVGNVDSRATEEAMGQLVGEQGLAVNAIVLKRGYAFIDCPNQQTFDDAINKLNGIMAPQKLDFCCCCCCCFIGIISTKSCHNSKKRVKFGVMAASVTCC